MNNLTQAIEQDWLEFQLSRKEALAHFSEKQVAVIHALIRQSPYAHSVLLKDDECLAFLAEENVWQPEFNWEAPVKQLQEALERCTNDALAKRNLRLWRHRLMCAIILRGIADLDDIETEMHHISLLADAIIKAAYQWLWPRFTDTWGIPISQSGNEISLLVLAMGKYGGFELNFSSDIDLIFFYSEDGNTSGGKRLTEHQTFFARLGQQLIALLAERTADGFCYRVDMRLRPYGEGGPLAMSFAAAEDYYQDQGREWERFAMIKARCITGSEAEQKEFYRLIRPFVFRRYIDFGVLESIREMKGLIEKEVRRKKLENNIKLGSGGIREAEFVVQSLQLISGGRKPNLQSRSFLVALKELVNEQLMQTATAEKLRESYLFLRETEHAIQKLHDHQSQLLPVHTLDQERMSEMLGCSSYDEFLKRLERHRNIIRQEFGAVFHVQDEGEEPELIVSIEHFSRDDVVQWLSITEQSKCREQFDDALVDELTQKIKQFIDSHAFQQLSSRGRTRFESLLPNLIACLTELPNPVQTWVRLVELLKSILKRTAYLVLLSENLPILEHLVKLCSQSDWVSRQLSLYPLLLDELLYPNSLYHPLSAENLQQQLREIMLRIEPDDEEQQQDQLRIFKQTNELRVAAASLNQTINVRKASRFLSQIAQAVLQSVTHLTWQKLCRKYGVPDIEGASEHHVKGFAVIAYGKFGGEELGFGSDLDLVFLYDANSEAVTKGNKSISHSVFFTRLAQRLINTLNMRTLSGVLYDVDMRLRPSGNSGLLVSHVDAFKDYQLNEAWTWEHQALTRARAVTGDETLIHWFEDFRLDIIRLPRDTQQLQQDVATMREKMRTTLDKSTGDSTDIKQGLGGMVDIEFIVQYLLLSHGQVHRDISWSSRTTRQLLQMIERDIFDQQSGEALIECYRVYRELANRKILMGESSVVEKEVVSEKNEQVLKIWHEVFHSVSDS